MPDGGWVSSQVRTGTCWPAARHQAVRVTRSADIGDVGAWASEETGRRPVLIAAGGGRNRPSMPVASAAARRAGESAEATGGAGAVAGAVIRLTPPDEPAVCVPHPARTTTAHPAIAASTGHFGRLMTNRRPHSGPRCNMRLLTSARILGP